MATYYYGPWVTPPLHSETITLDWRFDDDTRYWSRESSAGFSSGWGFRSAMPAHAGGSDQGSPKVWGHYAQGSHVLFPASSAPQPQPSRDAWAEMLADGFGFTNSDATTWDSVIEMYGASHEFDAASGEFTQTNAWSLSTPEFFLEHYPVSDKWLPPGTVAPEGAVGIEWEGDSWEAGTASAPRPPELVSVDIEKPRYEGGVGQFALMYKPPGAGISGWMFDASPTSLKNGWDALFDRLSLSYDARMAMQAGMGANFAQMSGVDTDALWPRFALTRYDLDWPGLYLPEDAGRQFVGDVWFQIELAYKSRPFRWVFDEPVELPSTGLAPLRQFPRSDALGAGSARRIIPTPASEQRGLRRMGGYF